jgi:MFS family permease
MHIDVRARPVDRIDRDSRDCFPVQSVSSALGHAHDSFDQVPWIITGYFLTQCGFILLVGQLLTVIKAKWILLAAIFFFELGSLLCAVANGMALLIFGRAVQGIGT